MIDFSRVKNYYIRCGYTDMRKQIDGLVALVQLEYRQEMNEESLFLFCGRRGDRIKALLWEGSGFLLLYKRFENGSISWPRTPDEAVSISKHEYRLLLQGLNPVKPKVRDISPSTAF